MGCASDWSDLTENFLSLRESEQEDGDLLQQARPVVYFGFFAPLYGAEDSKWYQTEVLQPTAGYASDTEEFNDHDHRTCVNSAYQGVPFTLGLIETGTQAVQNDIGPLLISLLLNVERLLIVRITIRRPSMYAAPLRRESIISQPQQAEQGTPVRSSLPFFHQIGPAVGSTIPSFTNMTRSASQPNSPVLSRHRCGQNGCLDPILCGLCWPAFTCSGSLLGFRS